MTPVCKAVRSYVRHNEVRCLGVMVMAQGRGGSRMVIYTAENQSRLPMTQMTWQVVYQNQIYIMW
jgi:hypothetical protein